MTDKHILKSFDDALENLFSLVTDMGQDVVDMVDTAGVVICDRDIETAKCLVRKDLETDHQQDEANAAVVELLSRFNPVARDLREVLALEHVAANLERIGDHAKGIAKRSIADPASLVSGSGAELLSELHKSVARSLSDVMRALGARNVQLADQVRRKDDYIDQLYDDLFHTVIADLQMSTQSAAGGVQALFIGKSLERIGDHATNIAEEVRFMAKGDMPTATREG